MKPRINSRVKGAGGEREFAAALHEELGVTLARNLEQSRSGGRDLSVVDNDHPLAGSLNRFAFEVKRHSQAKPGMIRQWWAQAVAQAFRADRERWRIVIPLCAVSNSLPYWPDPSMVAHLDIAGVAALVREHT